MKERWCLWCCLNLSLRYQITDAKQREHFKNEVSMEYVWINQDRKLDNQGDEAHRDCYPMIL